MGLGAPQFYFLTINPDGSIRNLNGFGEITGTRADFPARVIRFGLRLGF